MKNVSRRISMDMLTKKFYCHECGERLLRNPRTRTVKRGDSDYKEYSRVGRMQMIGDVEVTEYDFKCPSCDKIVEYDSQCVIAHIQKQSGRYTLSQAEIDEETANAKIFLNAKRRRTNVIAWSIFIVAFLFALYMSIKTGDFSIKL